MSRQALDKIIRSSTFLEFEQDYPVDASKVRAEFAGTRKPTPSSLFGQGMVTLCRAFPPADTNHPAPPPPVPPAGLGTYAQPGALVRDPRGGVEDVAAFKAAGGRWLLFNIGDHAHEEWATMRQRCEQQGVAWGYWRQCLTVAHLRELLQSAKATGGSLVGINVEQELTSILSPAVIRREVDAARISQEICTILLGWVQNDVDCRPIADWPALLEMFPADAPVLAPPKVKYPQCVEHAKSLGLKKPMQLAQCYHDGDPSWYDKPYHLYTLDDAQRLGVDAWI